MKILPVNRRLNSKCQTAKAIQESRGGKVKQPKRCEGCRISKTLLENANDPRIKNITTEGDAIDLGLEIMKEEERKNTPPEPPQKEIKAPIIINIRSWFESQK